MNVPTRFKPGTISVNSCSRFPISSALAVVTPVMCLPGRASDTTVLDHDRIGDSRDHRRNASAGVPGGIGHRLGRREDHVDAAAATISLASARRRRRSLSAERLINTRLRPSV